MPVPEPKLTNPTVGTPVPSNVDDFIGERERDMPLVGSTTSFEFSSFSEKQFDIRTHLRYNFKSRGGCYNLAITHQSRNELKTRSLIFLDDLQFRTKGPAEGREEYSSWLKTQVTKTLSPGNVALTLLKKL
ncbi:hypothetical protein RUM43_001443 [Polyplax serrata]|uniref:Uncharacterized protein n=1 Tax=Polyplax serrata TaxID=468196 RepID=A0AAN8SED4_POLSC